MGTPMFVVDMTTPNAIETRVGVPRPIEARVGTFGSTGTGEPGPPGPEGPTGPPGPQGESGGFYVFHQTFPSAVWVISHPLVYNPNVTVLDSAGSVVEGDIQFSPGQVTLIYSGAFSGTAYLS